MIDAKPLRIRFNKIDGFIRVYDGARYLVLFGAEKYDFICKRVRHLVAVKCGITNVISHNYEKFKIDSFNPLPLEEHWLCIMLKYSLCQF